MKNIGLFSMLLTISLMAYSQEKSIQAKLDSIINEGNLLYKYEKSVWNSTDLLMNDKNLKANYGGYIVSHSGDSVLVTYLDKSQKESTARYTYISADLEKPLITKIASSPLTALEKELFDIKIKIVNQLSDSKYGVTIPQGFSPNLELIKDNNEFKLYIIMGTSQAGVIPIGNDYVFKADRSGTITDWKKFHSRMIPLNTKGPNGEKVTSTFHSHLKTTPYITATDICTFRLYGKLCGMDDFTVLCTATGKYYKYKLKTNTIEISEP